MVKNPLANAGDTDWIPGLGRSPGEGNGNPLQYSCLGNPMDWGAWWAMGHGVTKSCIVDTIQQLNSNDISWDWSLAATLSSSMLGVRKERSALKWQTFRETVLRKHRLACGAAGWSQWGQSEEKARALGQWGRLWSTWEQPWIQAQKFWVLSRKTCAYYFSIQIINSLI